MSYGRAVRVGSIVFSGKPGANPRGYLKPSTHPRGREEAKKEPVDKFFVQLFHQFLQNLITSIKLKS